VIQCRVVGDEEATNAYGQPAFENGDFGRPRILPGPQDDYWDLVDFVVDLAARYGFHLALLPIWANSIPPGHPMESNPTIAYEYGRFLGQRYGRRPHIIWVLGGDPVKERDVYNPARLQMIRAMAEALAMEPTVRVVMMGKQTGTPP